MGVINRASYRNRLGQESSAWLVFNDANQRIQRLEWDNQTDVDSGLKVWDETQGLIFDQVFAANSDGRQNLANVQLRVVTETWDGEEQDVVELPESWTWAFYSVYPGPG